MRDLVRLAVAVVLAACFAASASAAPQVPSPVGRVNDFADVLTPAQEANLDQKLQQIEALPKHPQVAILTVKDTGGEELADYATQLGDKWGIGKKGEDNGVLIIVATHPEDPKAFGSGIAVGYGLEGVIPDIKAEAIRKEKMSPYFQNAGHEDYMAAFTGAVEAIRLILADGATGNDAIDHPAKIGEKAWGALLFLLFLFVSICTVHWIAGIGLGGSVGFVAALVFSLAPLFIVLCVAAGAVAGLLAHFLGRAIMIAGSSGGGDDFGSGGDSGGGGFSVLGGFSTGGGFGGFGGGGFGGGGSFGGR